MKLQRSLLVALIISLSAIATWEVYSRKSGYIAAINDDKALWAVQRSKIDQLTHEDVVVIGSSRTHFDIQLDEWQAVTGRRPLMLSNDGATPTPVFIDIVENSDYKGTVLIGVAPGLFFSAPIPQAPPWKRAQTRVDHYYDRTWAQRINHLLSLPIERTFAFLNAAEEEWADDLDLKTLVSRVKIGARLGPSAPPFYNFQYVDEERNTTMFEKTVSDTAFANTIKRVWLYFGRGAPPPVKEEIFAIYEDLISKFMARGGNVVFIRCPSSGDVRIGEQMSVPRAEYWDSLLIRTNTRGYHFEDYPELGQYVIPEWSHLATPDARKFTIDFAGILLHDNAIPNHQ